MSPLRALLPALCMMPLLAHAVTYYISHNGNDANSGTSPQQAWRTLTRAQQGMFQMQPGDQMLFERGGTYTGLLSINRNGTAAQPLVFGAYGNGAKPVISGAVPVTGWTPYQGNIWRAPFTGDPKYLLVNNAPMTLARFPNEGWIRNEQGSASSIHAGSVLTQPNGYWNGSRVVVRTTNWSYEKSTVSSFANGTLFFPAILTDLANDDWGFFLENSLNALDMAGEWYHDASTGHIYFWAPGNADPNTLQVGASIHDRGFAPGWQNQHIRIQDLSFQGQTASSISTETSHYVTVTGCTFRYAFHAISSTGTNHQYINNTFHDIFATAVRILGETNTVVENNTFDHIGTRPGMGEPWWGYIGIRMGGNNCVLRNNRFTNIGYIGITVEGNTLVERNVVQHTGLILNDGAGIAFDHADGLVIRDNIVLDIDGDLTSVATSHTVYYKIAIGLYFGNTSIRNTTVERNTVARCRGAGIHVDHTTVSQGNAVRDNLVFDCAIQLSCSDFSNPLGAGAQPPYHVPQFDTEYSGNILYSVRPEQLVMRHYNVYSADPVDFGTFTNNRYFSPYDEVGIFIFNTFSGQQEFFTLEQWQESRNTDQGSTRSPLRMSKYRVDQVLTPNMIPNGDLNGDVSDWTGWPTETTLTRSDSLLDNGALKLNFLNTNSYYEHFLNTNSWATLQDGEMYRLAFSIQSDLRGQLRARLRGQSQWQGAYSMWEHRVPFDGERRDLEFFIRSDRSEPGRVQFVNFHANDRRYFLDNVRLERVQVTELDPYDDHKLFVNDQQVTLTFPLPEGCWSDVNGVVYSGSVSVGPFASVVVYRLPDTGGCGSATQGSMGLKVLLGGPLDWGTGMMNGSLVDLGLLPSSEPYTALGYDLGNPGVSALPAVLQGTGPGRIMDWVLVELRGNDAGFPLVERRAALLRADGRVVAPTGEEQLNFQNSVESKHVVVRHRNHLPVMTAAPMLSNGLYLDLTDINVPLLGMEPAKVWQGRRALWPGDVNRDAVVRYAGASNDRDPVLQAVGAEVPSQVEMGYLLEDINLDGLVKYTGSGNDRDLILNAIGGVVPTNVRTVQVP